MLDIIRLFDPIALSEERRIGPACIERPPEAQYKDEFYRCSFKGTGGCHLSFPEFGKAARRVDFYVPSKKWGIELLRDGDHLEEHPQWFSRAEAHGSTLDILDHVILDFRKSRPGSQHPREYQFHLFLVLSLLA